MGRDSNQLSGTPGDEQVLVGTLREQSLADGSKLAHSAPVLVLDDGSWARVMVEGDNPFLCESLRQRLGQRVAIEGRWRGLVLRAAIDGVRLVSDGDE